MVDEIAQEGFNDPMYLLQTLLIKIGEPKGTLQHNGQSTEEILYKKNNHALTTLFKLSYFEFLIGDDLNS